MGSSATRRSPSASHSSLSGPRSPQPLPRRRLSRRRRPAGSAPADVPGCAPMARLDPHSYCDDTQAATESFALTARVDFATRTLAAEVTLTFRTPARGRLDLDTRDLAIEHVRDASGATLKFELHAAEPYIGQRLSIELAAETPTVTIRY